MTRAPKTTGTAVANWDEELAKLAQLSAGMEESTASGQFFSLKSGQLSFNDTPLPGNEMAVVILDSVLENVYYEGDYDSDEPQSPTCFAFGRDEKSICPHTTVVEHGSAQSEQCQGCPQNEWGSANKGRGKACRNTRRLGMIPAGVFKNGKFDAVKDVAHYESAGVGYMKLPVTSVKGYAAFVKQLQASLSRPPLGVFTKVQVVPDSNTQFKVLFTAIDTVPANLLPTLLARHNEVKGLIESPYSLAEEAPAKPARGRAKPAAKKPAARGGKY